MAPKSVGLKDSPWENHSSSRERRRFCVSRAWRCSSQRTAIVEFSILFVLLGRFSSVGYSFVFFGQKLEDPFCSDDSESDACVFFRVLLLLLILFRRRRARARERDENVVRARVFINVAQKHPRVLMNEEI